MTNPVDNAFPPASLGNRGQLIAWLKAGLLNVFTSATEAAGYDLAGYRYILIASNHSFYQFDPISTASHDGVLVIVDSEGNRFLKRDGIMTAAMFDHVGSGVPDPGLGADGEIYYDPPTSNVYLKAAGAWSVVGNIRGPEGTARWEAGIVYAPPSPDVMVPTVFTAKPRLSGARIADYFFAEISAGAAGDSCDVTVLADGGAVYGPVSVAHGSPLIQTGLALNFSAGQKITIHLENFAGDPRQLEVEIEGDL